jgi:TolB-like protein/Tfp pilus assembly protein PilF
MTHRNVRFGTRLSSFLKELRKRKVIRAGAFYLISAWVLMQVADVMFPALALPPWTVTLVAALLIIGFPLALILAWAYELTPGGIKLDTATSADSDSALPVPSQTTDSESIKSIAILPFIDLSPERDNEYFSDGLTEELLHVLAAASDLKVSSRTSCFTFKGKDIDIPTVAKKLKVANVLEGSVRKSGARLRITAQLIDAKNDTHLWSDTYDRDLDNIFEIQDDIAQQIAQALRVRLDLRQPRSSATDSVKAYDLYLRGRGFHRKFSLSNLRFAIEMFAKATEVDPNFAQAWCGAADCHSLLALYLGTGETDRAAAGNASRRAIELAPDLAEAHVSRGLYHVASEQFADAVREFARAIELDPNMPEAYYQMGRACIHRNELGKALAWFEKAMELSPDDFEIPLIAAPICEKLGDTERSKELNARGLENTLRYLETNPDVSRAYYLGAGALLQLNKKQQADEWAKRALAIDPSDGSTQYNVACFYAQAGEPDKAFACLEKGGIHSVAWLQNDPDLDPIRPDPRFNAIIQRLGSDGEKQST